MQQYYKLITDWAEKREIISGSTYTKQGLKLIEELGELTGAHAKCDYNRILDAVGDVFVVACILHKMKTPTAPALYTERHERGTYAKPDDILLDLARNCTNTLYWISRDNESQAYSEMYDLVDHLQEYCLAMEIEFRDCVVLAWEEIKDRRGVMHEGVFIKEHDIEAKLAKGDIVLQEFVAQLDKNPADEVLAHNVRTLQQAQLDLADMLVRARRS